MRRRKRSQGRGKKMYEEGIVTQEKMQWDIL